MLIAEPVLPSRAIALWAVLFSAVSMVVSLFATMVFLIRLPPGAFAETRRTRPRSIPGLIARVLTNLAGWVLILVGVVLSIPGVPGQGLLTILLGLLLVDFPGRTRLLRRILTRPAIRRTIDRLRIRFKRPPFTW